MATETVSVIIGGDASGLERATVDAQESLAKISGSMKRVNTTSAHMGETTQKAMNRAGDAAEKAGKDIAGMSKKLTGAEKIAQGFGGKIGEMAGRLKNFGEGFAALGASGGPVIAFGGAIAVVTAAAAASVVSLGLMAGAMVGIVASADEAIKRLKGVVEVSDEQSAAVMRANDALHAIGVVFDMLTVSLGAEFAPTVERVSTLIVALGLAGVDAMNWLGKSVNVATEMFAGLVNFVIGPASSAFAIFVKQAAMVADLLGLDIAEDMHKVADGFGDIGHTIVNSTVGAFEAVEVQSDGYIEKAKVLIGTLGELRKEQDKVTESADRVAASSKAAGESLGTASATAAPAGKPLTDTFAGAEFDSGLGDAEGKLKESLKDRDWAEWADEAADAIAPIVDLADAASDAISGIGAAITSNMNDAKKAAKVQFKIDKAAAIASATVSGAMAVIKALASGLFPANLIMASLTGAAVAAQVATIASAKPPTFHFGGEVTRGGVGAGPGDVPAVLQVGERVQTQAERMDERRGRPGLTTAVLQLGHRTMEAITMTQLDDPRSALGIRTLPSGYGHRAFAGAR